MSRQKVADAKKVLKSKGGKPVAYTNPYLLGYRLAKYIEDCRDSMRPLTEMGLILAMNVTRPTYLKYANGEMDAYTGLKCECRESEADVAIAIDRYRKDERLEATYNLLTEGSAKGIKMSEVIEKARMLVSLEREERLSATGKVGDIFIMKAREGWQDTSEAQKTVIEIKNDNALEALKQLGYTPIEGGAK